MIAAIRRKIYMHYSSTVYMARLRSMVISDQNDFNAPIQLRTFPRLPSIHAPAPIIPINTANLLSRTSSLIFLHFANVALKSPAVLAVGNEVSGTGIPKNLHSRSHPSCTRYSSNRLRGTVRLTLSQWSL